MTAVPTFSIRSRRLLKFRGVVQGVGFRPAIYRFAVEHRLGGYVRNDADGVTLEIEGDCDDLDAFAVSLQSRAPLAARIDHLEIREVPPVGERTFAIETSTSAANGSRTETPADRATCDACLRELFDPHDRRYRYPFITCTDCGPRFTIISDVPYDRTRTTMAPFQMCDVCRREYEDPLDRRFHAETNACASCGPRLLPDHALSGAVARLRDGAIVAVKGLGGFHLAADARNENAVARLRAKKHRPAKPFAVMVRDIGVASLVGVVDDDARSALLHPSRPIVCLRSRTTLASSVAPLLSEIGVMLPYTPLHHLLLADGPDVLVMTSGNEADEPIVIDDDDALERLGTIADAFLLHDRPIYARADDSVVRIVSGRPQPVRRSRGMVPEPVMLPFDAPPVLAVGAELKNTICMTRGNAAYVSQHIGDLSHWRSFSFFEEVVRQAEAVVVAHDLHPDYRSTRWALDSGLPRIAVQHHHAHIASCLAENGRTDHVIGVAFDGTGCGPAGELWGGEILVCDLAAFERAGHLRPIALAGGEAAIREPWRLAVAALLDAGVKPPSSERARRIEMLIENETHSPRATSAGRWFDAIAALCGLCDTISYEAQAAMELESIAAPGGSPYPYEIASGEIDLRPAVRVIASRGDPAAIVAARFHETLVRSTAEFCERLREQTHLETVALSGGCFQNKRLTERLSETLEQRGFEVLLHRRVPPNDGGISLGQAAVAAWKMRGAS